MFNQIMKNTKRNALVAAGAVLISATALTGAAEAKPKNFHLHIGGPGFGVAIGHGGYYGGPYYGNPCRWLRRKARKTGKFIWWKRYQRCMNQYYW